MNLRDLAREGARMTVAEIASEFPELGITLGEAPRKMHWTQTERGRQILARRRRKLTGEKKAKR